MDNVYVYIIKKYPRMFVAIISLIVRLIPAYIFYGSVDTDAYAGIVSCIINNGSVSFESWNYFPTISFFLWIIGFLSVYTFLPLPLCVKIIPIIADIGIALLIYDMVGTNNKKYAFTSALLYALNPVSIVITAIHSQWESVFLFLLLLAFYVRDYYQPSYRTFFIYGLLFGISILIKPIGLVFLLIFFTPYRGMAKEFDGWWRLFKVLFWVCSIVMMSSFIMFAYTKARLTVVKTFINNYAFLIWIGLMTACVLLLTCAFMWLKLWKRFSAKIKQYLLLQGSSFVGFMSIIMINLFIFIVINFDLLVLMDNILRYANKGPQGIGLPLAVEWFSSRLAACLKNRMVFLFGYIGIAYWYYHHRITAFETICLSYAFTFGVMGVCPHYFVWIVPFLLLCNFRYVTIVYTFVVSVMYMVCYHPPATEDWAFLYRISFAPLRNFAWLTPPEWMTGWGAALVLKLLGNVIIPSICLGIIVYAISQIKKKGTLQWQYVWLHKEKLLIPAAHYLFSFVLVVAIVMCCMLLANPDYLRESYNVLFLHRYDAYALIKINQPVVIRSMILQCEASTFFNAITIFICLLGMWVTYAIVSWRKENESRNKQQN